MIIVIVDFATSPENADVVHRTLQAEVADVRALAGNLSYGFWSDPDHPGTWRLMHEWASPAGLAAYRETPGFKAAGAVLFPLMIGKPTSRVFAADVIA